MNSNNSWVLKVKDNVYKELSRFPEKDRAKLTRVIEKLPADPYWGDIEKMEGELCIWRRRVGAYRIFYEIVVQGKVIHVYRVQRRTSRTY